MPVPTLCDWFSSSASAYDSDNFSLDRKPRSRKRSQNAVFTKSLLLITTPTLTLSLVKTSLKELTTILIYATVGGTFGNRAITPEERLIDDLLKNYTKEARPVKYPNETIEVEFGFELVQLVHVVSE